VLRRKNGNTRDMRVPMGQCRNELRLPTREGDEGSRPAGRREKYKIPS